jgi:hypothetical protein
MKSLVRKQFVDQLWGVADLDAAAEFWLRLYERAASSRALAPSPRHRIEIRLTGFPKHTGEALRRELESRAAASDICRPEVVMSNPETLLLTSGTEPGDIAPPGGLGVPILSGPPFDGLVAEIRIIADGREGRLIGTKYADGALVIVGELRDGGLLVKAIWRSESVELEGNMHWATPSPYEVSLLAGFEEFRKTGEVAKSLAKKFFKPATDDYFGWLTFRWILPRMDRPRLSELLLRISIFVATFTALACITYRAVNDEEWLWLGLVILVDFYFACLFAAFAVIETRLVFAYRHFRTEYERDYADPAHYGALSRGEATSLLRDPAV